MGTFLAFYKRVYNYVEHFIINAFLTAQSLIVHITLFPFTYAFNETPTLKVFSGIENIISVGLAVWVFVQFFNKEKKLTTFWRTLLSFLIYIILYIVLSTAIATIIYFIKLKH